MGAKQADLRSGKTVAPALHSGEQLAFRWGAAQGSGQLHPESARVFKASCSQNKESAACSLHACADAGMLGVVRFSLSRLSRLPLETNGFNCMQQSGLRAEFQKLGHDISST